MVVCKTNSLVRASFSLTLNEKRLLLACIAQIKDPKSELAEDAEFTITAPYFSTLFGIDTRNAYKQMGEAADLLLERVVIIDNPNELPGTISRRKVNWVSKADYYDKEGKVSLQFNRYMLPYISNLTSGCFTQYGINQVAQLKSVYAIRLYELLVCESWKGETFEISITELRYILGITSEYPKTFEFKRCVVNPCVSAIVEHTNCKNLSYEQKKTGRDVTHLVFTYAISGAIAKKSAPKIKPLPKTATLTKEQSDKVLKEHQALLNEMKSRKAS